MGTSKYVTISLIVALVAVVAVGQDRPAARSPNAPAGSPKGQPRGDAEAVNLVGQRSELTNKVQGLELDLAGIDARRKALQEQIAMIRDEAGKRLGEDVVTQELQKLLATREQNLVQLKQSAAAGRASLTDVGHAQESAAEARIDLARRREELSKLAGGGQLEEFTRELSRLAIDKAGKEAQQQVVRRQLEEVQKQLAQAAPQPTHTDAEAVNLGGQKNELTRRAQALELDLVGIDARCKALQEQIGAARKEGNKQLAQDPVTQELQRLLGARENSLRLLKQYAVAGRTLPADVGHAEESVAEARIDLARRREELSKQAGGGQSEEFTGESRHLAISKAEKEAQQEVVRRQLKEVQKQLAQAAPQPSHTDAEAVNLGGQKNELTRRAQVLELDLAGIDARCKALQEQIGAAREEGNKQLAQDPVTQELEKFLTAREESLANIKKTADAGAAVAIAQAEERVAEARVDLARRREEVSRRAGGGQLEDFTKELGHLVIDKAEKEAQLQTVRKQLEEVQKQLAEALEKG
jgi:chromosome segregation ATPase